MKLTAVLLLAISLQISAEGLSQKVTLNYKNAPVKKVFKEIFRQTEVSIFYREAQIEGLSKVTLNVKDMPLEEVFPNNQTI